MFHFGDPFQSAFFPRPLQLPSQFILLGPANSTGGKERIHVIALGKTRALVKRPQSPRAPACPRHQNPIAGKLVPVFGKKPNYAWWNVVEPVGQFIVQFHVDDIVSRAETAPTTGFLSIVKPDHKKLDLSADQELWAAVGRDWTLPLWVRWGIEKKSKAIYGVITPACGLYSQQELTLNALFEDHDIQGLTSSWIVPQEKIHELLKKAPGVKPFAYYQAPESMPFMHLPSTRRSGSERGRLSREETTNLRGKTDSPFAFASHISRQYAIPVSTVKAVLDAIATEGAKWLIEFHRPMDLGFCTLIAAPFRKNWVQIVAQKFREYPMLKILKQPNRREILREITMPESLCSPQNIGIKSNHNDNPAGLDYTIEAIPTARFEQVAGMIERARHAAGTTVENFENTVESLYEPLLKVLQTYLEKTRLPFGKVHQSSSRSKPCLLPSRGDVPTVSGMGLSKLPVYIIPPSSGFSVQAESRVENVVLPKVKVVSKVPPLFQATENLRVGSIERDVEESGNGETGTAGVPLRSHTEGGDA